MNQRLLAAILIATLAAPAAAADEAGAEPCLAKAQSILDALDGGEYEHARADFNAEMRAHLAAAQLEAVWTSLPKQAGARLKVAAGRSQTRPDGSRTAVIPLQYTAAWLELQVSCAPGGEVSGLYVRPGQAPADTSAAAPASADGRTHERELLVGSGALALPATLTLPRTAPVAGVVLVHGSGAHDRDETIGPNRPFRDLAIGLAERGVAVLRYEKRSRAHPESFSGVSFTVREEVVDDALLALAALKAAPELEGKPIFLAGHSLGAMLAPRIALEARELRGMVLLAAPARGLADLIPEQIQYLNALDGVTSDEERAKFAEIQTVLARVSKLSDADRNDPTPILGAPAAYWLDLANYQPIRQAERLKLPTLLLQGERDYQVTPAKDYRAWTEALGTADWFQSRQFPGLSHLFMPAADPASPADYQAPAHVSADVLDAMASWIKQQATGS